MDLKSKGVGTMLQTNDAVAVPSGQGEARWWFGALVEIKATAAVGDSRWSKSLAVPGMRLHSTSTTARTRDSGFSRDR
jgi:hypothetical protein